MLQLHGVRHIFGLCGDTSLPLYDALYRLDHGITHILTRDERSAAYMADAYARVTGRVGVCEGPSRRRRHLHPAGRGRGQRVLDPGARGDDRHRGRLARPLRADRARPGGAVPAADQVEPGDRPRAPGSRQALRAAFRQMTTGRPGAAHIGLPFDVQKEPVDEADAPCRSDARRLSRRAAPRPSPARDRGRGRGDPRGARARS